MIVKEPNMSVIQLDVCIPVFYVLQPTTLVRQDEQENIAEAVRDVALLVDALLNMRAEIRETERGKV